MKPLRISFGMLRKRQLTTLKELRKILRNDEWNFLLKKFIY
jgi:hypothetical protein